jgi:hypothetical protein
MHVAGLRCTVLPLARRYRVLEAASRLIQFWWRAKLHIRNKTSQAFLFGSVWQARRYALAEMSLS